MSKKEIGKSMDIFSVTLSGREKVCCNICVYYVPSLLNNYNMCSKAQKNV